ncbi:hypothetical protein Q2941_08985 [Bradyrhizobium sp. UFLA05-153]
MIAADLRSLIAQIETGMRLIEAAITLEDACDPPGSTEIFVLLRHGKRSARCRAGPASTSP